MDVVCPHCHSTLPACDPSAKVLVCPGCGSSIQLDPGATAAWLPSEAPRRLGKFEFLEQLGLGAFGTVYKARDTELGRLVAVKVPRAGSVPRPEDLDRFLREARSAARLQHPGIVAVYDAGQAEGTLYLVSEFVQGATLAERLTAGRMSFRQAAALVAEVAEALQYAHAHGVVHRDIKPSNIMMDLEGKPHVMDFGLAKGAAEDGGLTLEGQVLGTPAYMAPEQARGEVKKVDARSDVYSLGVVLYELLTEELPFRGQARMLLVQVMQEEPRPPRKLNDRVPKDLETVCLKAMAKEPGRRYQSAQEFADDLRRWLKGEPIQARPAGAWERGWRWVNRRPAVAGLLAIGLVAALALVGVIVGAAYNARLQVALAETQWALETEEQQRKKAEQFQYFHHIAQAFAGWREGNVGERVDQLLEELPPERRRWEWYYLHRLGHTDLLTLRGHAGWVYSVAFSPDGKTLASASWDQTVKVWDAATGKELLTLRGHTDRVYSVAYRPDGKWLASAGADGTVKVWDATTGVGIHSLSGHEGEVWDVTFNPDGTRLASASGDGTVKVWNATVGDEIRTITGHGNLVAAVAFSPEGKKLASASHDHSVKVWDATTGKELFPLGGHRDRVSSVTFSPNGTQLASAGHDHKVKVWDATTGNEVHTLRGHTGVIRWVAFSPDGSRLASASWDGSVRVWDVATGKELRTLKGHAFGVRGVAFSPDGIRLASAAIDRTVKIWDGTTSQETRTLIGHVGDIARGGGAGANRAARILAGYSGGVNSVEFLTGGTQLASAGADGTVRVWDVATGQEVRTLAGHTGRVWGVAASPRKTWLASASEDQTVKVWDIKPGRGGCTLRGHTGAVYFVAFSPDGTRLASASGDKTVKVWDVATGKELRTLKGHTDAVYCVTFSPDRTRLASAGADRTVKVWDATTDTVPLTLSGHIDSVCGVAFSPDGSRLASASWDGSVKVWDVATRQEVRTLKGHASLVFGVAFSPDGSRLATAGLDQTVKVWDTETGHDLLTLKGHTGLVRAVAFSADGTRLATAGGDGTVKLWDARPWGPEALAEREALGLLEFLFTKPLRKTDVLAYLRTSSTISPQAPDKALRLAEHFREETDPERYHQASWAVVRRPYLNAFQYRFALMQAETACRLAPKEAKYRTALGAARYRAGRYKEARSTLAKADALHRADLARLTGLGRQPLQLLAPLCQAQPLRQAVPANLAFLAMAQHRLGQKEQARATLARLREAAQQAPSNKDEEAHDLLREAEALMGAKGRPTDK